MSFKTVNKYMELEAIQNNDRVEELIKKIQNAKLLKRSF